MQRPLTGNVQSGQTHEDRVEKGVLRPGVGGCMRLLMGTVFVFVLYSKIR